MKIKELLEDTTDYHQIDIVVSKALKIAERILNNLSYLDKLHSTVDDVLNWDELLNEQDS